MMLIPAASPSHQTAAPVKLQTPHNKSAFISGSFFAEALDKDDFG